MAVVKGKAKAAIVAAKEKNCISDGVVGFVEVVDRVESDDWFEYRQGGGPGLQERPILLILAHGLLHGDERVPSQKKRRRRTGEHVVREATQNQSPYVPADIYSTSVDPSRRPGMLVVE